MNPVEKFLMQKQAGGFGDAIGQVGKALPGAVAMGVAGGGLAAGATGMAYGAQTLYDAITKRRDFRSMLEYNPDLHAELEKNPKFFNQAFTSLRNINPQFSKDPLIAGNYLRQMMDGPMGAGGKLEAAVGMGREQKHPVLDAFSRGAQEGAKGGFKEKKEPKDKGNQLPQGPRGKKSWSGPGDSPNWP